MAPRERRSFAAASRGAVALLLLMLSVLVGPASARRRGMGSVIKQGPLVQEGSFVKDNWILNREFFYRRDQPKNGSDVLVVRENKLAKFSRTGEVGYWKVERRPLPGAPARKTPLANEMVDVLVLDIPEQGDRKNLIVSYEIPVVDGRYHPSAIMFAPQGSIYVAGSKEELVGPAAAKRKKIGSFSVDLPTLPPMVDRAFTL